MGKKRSKATCKQKHAKAAAFSSSLKKTVRSVHRGGTTKGQRSRIESSVRGVGGGGGIVPSPPGGGGASSSPRRRGSGGGGAGKRPRPDATKRWTGPQNFKDQQRPQQRSGGGDEEDAAFAREVASLNEREGRDRVRREQRASLSRRSRRRGGASREGAKGADGSAGAAGSENGKSSLFGCPSGATFRGEGVGGVPRDIVHDAADRVASGLRVEGARPNGHGGGFASDSVSPLSHPWDQSPNDQRSKWIIDQERSREAEERARIHERESGNRYAAFADDVDGEDEDDDVGVDGEGPEARGKKKVANPLMFAPPSFKFNSTATTNSRCELREEEVDPDL